MKSVRAVAAFAAGALEGFYVVGSRDLRAGETGQLPPTILDSASLDNADASNPIMRQSGAKMATNCGSAKTSAVETKVQTAVANLAKYLAVGSTISATMGEPVVLGTDLVTGSVCANNRPLTAEVQSEVQKDAPAGSGTTGRYRACEQFRVTAKAFVAYTSFVALIGAFLETLRMPLGLIAHPFMEGRAAWCRAGVASKFIALAWFSIVMLQAISSPSAVSVVKDFDQPREIDQLTQTVPGFQNMPTVCLSTSPIGRGIIRPWLAVGVSGVSTAMFTAVHFAVTIGRLRAVFDQEVQNWVAKFPLVRYSKDRIQSRRQSVHNDGFEQVYFREGRGTSCNCI